MWVIRNFDADVMSVSETRESRKGEEHISFSSRVVTILLDLLPMPRDVTLVASLNIAKFCTLYFRDIL